MVAVLAPEAVYNLTACPGISVVDVKDQLEDVDGDAPCLASLYLVTLAGLALVMLIELLHQHGTLVLVDCLGNLSLYKIEELNVLGNLLHQL